MLYWYYGIEFMRLYFKASNSKFLHLDTLGLRMQAIFIKYILLFKNKQSEHNGDLLNIISM